jgi:hypothetical protein
VLQPPVHDTVAFGEKAMAAEVDAIPLVVDGSRNASHVRALFQDYGDDIGTAEQFVGGGQAGGAGPDDDGSFLHAREITVMVDWVMVD